MVQQQICISCQAQGEQAVVWLESVFQHLWVLCRHLTTPISPLCSYLSSVFLFLSLYSSSWGTVPGSFSRSWLLSSRTICPSGRWWQPPPAWYVATLRALSPESPPLTGTRTTTTKPSWASAAAGHRTGTHMTTAPVSRPYITMSYPPLQFRQNSVDFFFIYNCESYNM